MESRAFAVVLIINFLKCTFGQVPMTPNSICLPNPPALKAEQLSTPFSTCGKNIKSVAQKHPDQDLLTPDILKKYKYPFETHNVTTKDGYILTVYRITGSPNSKQKKGAKKQAVYLNHGLGAASDSWNFQPGNRNLPFKLADAGYEVWMSNCRGTSYSTKHTKYNAEKDWAQYWNFSWHEMGIYDVPAVTDKIIKESKNKKIFYIGHSMGTTQYFVSLSEIPKMNDKISAGFMLAPIAFLGHANNGLRLATPLICTDLGYQAANTLLQGRLNSAGQFRKMFKVSPGDLCDLTATKCGVCDNLLFLLFGYDAPQVNNTEVPNMLAKFPNTVSIKTFAHYAQTMDTCTFKKYDYGPAGNTLAYKSLTAPAYKIEKITAPTFFYWGNLDNLGPPNDVNITASKMKKGVLKGNTKVKHDLFNHMDFVIAKDADKLLYNQILSEMKKFK